MTPVQQAVANAGIAAIGIGFLAGLFFSFNPVAMASIPVSLAYVTKARERKQAILFGMMFIAGMLVVHTAMGFVAGLGGHRVDMFKFLIDARQRVTADPAAP